MFLITKKYSGGTHMSQIHFTLEMDEIQNLIENLVQDDLAKNSF